MTMVMTMVTMMTMMVMMIRNDGDDDDDDDDADDGDEENTFLCTKQATRCRVEMSVCIRTLWLIAYTRNRTIANTNHMPSTARLLVADSRAPDGRAHEGRATESRASPGARGRGLLMQRSLKLGVVAHSRVPINTSRRLMEAASQYANDILPCIVKFVGGAFEIVSEAFLQGQPVWPHRYEIDADELWLPVPDSI